MFTSWVEGKQQCKLRVSFSSTISFSYRIVVLFTMGYYCISVDQTANDLLSKVFPVDETRKEVLNLSPERCCVTHIDYKLVTCLSQYSS